MLRQSDLNNQKTFFKHTNGNWYDGMWDYELSFPEGKAVLSIHNEVDGSTEHLSVIDNLEHLKDVYEMITNDEFN
jgi:hypothetical protein